MKYLFASLRQHFFPIKSNPIDRQIQFDDSRNESIEMNKINLITTLLTEYLASSQAQHFSPSKASTSLESISQKVLVKAPSSAYQRTLFSKTMAVNITHPDPDGGALHITWTLAKVRRRVYTRGSSCGEILCPNNDNAVGSNVSDGWPVANRQKFIRYLRVLARYPPNLVNRIFLIEKKERKKKKKIL